MRVEDPLAAKPPLVIGVGNPDRGDDALGPLVVERVRRIAPHLETLIVKGDLSNLVLRWTANQDVIVVDAVQSSRPAGSLTVTPVHSTALPITESVLSSHGIGLAEAVELARLLKRLPRSLTVVGVEAKAFGRFEPLTEEVAAAMPAALQTVLELAATTESAQAKTRDFVL